jgi:hypothetical protein
VHPAPGAEFFLEILRQDSLGVGADVKSLERDGFTTALETEEGY